MASSRITVSIDPRQIDDVKEFVRRENSRKLGLTPQLAEVAISLSGWIETTGPADPGRTFVPGPEASQDHPVAELARIRRRLKNLAEDLAEVSGGSVSVTMVREQIQDMLK